MALDLATAKVGDRLVLRNASVVKITELDDADQEQPIYAHGYWYGYDGLCPEFEDNREYDAIAFIPCSEPTTKPSQPPVFDFKESGGVPATVPATSTLTIGGCWDGIEHPAVIKCNNKIYTPADSWPEPITDRRPSKEDADADGRVQWLSPPGCWLLAPWQHGYGCPGWQHTPNWKAPAPKPPTLKEATESVVEYYYNGGGINDEFAAIMDNLKTALEATK